MKETEEGGPAAFLGGGFSCRMPPRSLCHPPELHLESPGTSLLKASRVSEGEMDGQGGAL